MHQQIHPASVRNFIRSFKGLGLSDLDLGQTVHRFFILVFSPEIETGIRYKKNKPLRKGDALGMGQPLQRNEDVK